MTHSRTEGHTQTYSGIDFTKEPLPPGQYKHCTFTRCTFTRTKSLHAASRNALSTTAN